jgi:chromosome segregation ATPase
LNRSTNNCRATFYVTQPQVNRVLDTLTAYDGVEVNRTTESVTRHREEIQGQTSILQQQLASVERSLAIAETEFDEIATFARETNDAETLASAIREKLSLIDTLTQRKISLVSRIDSYMQQAADLEERLNVVQFSVNVDRSYPLSLNRTSRQWERAWAELDEQFTDTLIGLTAFFGIFLLWSVRIVIYALVGIVVVRGLWKFARLVWRRW